MRFALVFVLLTSILAAPWAQIQKGLNDPETLAATKMKALPSSLKLTPGQRKGLHGLFIAESRDMQQVEMHPSGHSMKVRFEIGKLMADYDKRIQSLLSPKQYQAYKRWERPGGH